MAETWLLCSACRTEITFGSRYYQCSVSTCNRTRMRLVFCSVACWDSHVATLRHRDAWAEDRVAPTRVAWERELNSQSPEPARPAAAPPRPNTLTPSISRPPPPGTPTAVPSMMKSSPTGPVSAPSMVKSSPMGPVSASSINRPPPMNSSLPAAVPTRRFASEPAPSSPPSPSSGPVHLNDIVDRDMLVVVSKLKKYIKDRSGMNCSDAVAEVLSDHVRILCDDSIRAAGREERKTVLDRDVPRPRRP
jgi:hypothetical protein